MIQVSHIYILLKVFFKDLMFQRHPVYNQMSLNCGQYDTLNSPRKCNSSLLYFLLFWTHCITQLEYAHWLSTNIPIDQIQMLS